MSLPVPPGSLPPGPSVVLPLSPGTLHPMAPHLGVFVSPPPVPSPNTDPSTSLLAPTQFMIPWCPQPPCHSPLCAHQGVWSSPIYPITKVPPLGHQAFHRPSSLTSFLLGEHGDCCQLRLWGNQLTPINLPQTPHSTKCTVTPPHCSPLVLQSQPGQALVHEHSPWGLFPLPLPKGSRTPQEPFPARQCWPGSFIGAEACFQHHPVAGG